MNNCFSIYHTSWITSGPKNNFICDNMPTKAIMVFFGCPEVNSTWLITSELANQWARKVLFCTLVSTYFLGSQLYCAKSCHDWELFMNFNVSIEATLDLLPKADWCSVHLMIHRWIERFSFECRKVIGFAFATLRDWLKKWRQFFIQSEVKPKPIATHSQSFSHALRQLPVISSSFDWFTVLCVFFVIG